MVNDFNEYCKVEDEDDVEQIKPEILGVVFTMVQFYGGEPIAALRQYINQTRRLKIPIFEDYIRENKTIFSDAPQYGVPVVLSNHPRLDITAEISNFVDEFIDKIF